MYSVVDSLDTVLDILAHEKMNGNNPKVYSKGDQYAVEVVNPYPGTEKVKQLKAGWRHEKDFGQSVQRH